MPGGGRNNWNNRNNNKKTLKRSFAEKPIYVTAREMVVLFSRAGVIVLYCSFIVPSRSQGEPD